MIDLEPISKIGFWFKIAPKGGAEFQTGGILLYVEDLNPP